MADKEGEERVPKKGGGDFWQKYRTYIIIGVVIIGALVFFFVRQSNANSTGAAATGAPATPNPNALAALNGIDPATGIPYADEFGQLNQGATNYTPAPPPPPNNTTTNTTTTTNNYYGGPGAGPGVPGTPSIIQWRTAPAPVPAVRVQFPNRAA